jgi:hypothetical protein
MPLAGCGTAGGDEVATAGGKSTTSNANPAGGDERDNALKFAQCMRDNGLPEFPDPKIGPDGEVQMSTPDGVDQQKADAATEKCRQYLPNGGEPQKIDPQLLDQLRKYSQCMRANGVPNFPDPDENGGIQIDNDKLGIDPQSPQFKQTEAKCQKLMPGGGKGGGGQTGNGE